MDKRLQNILDIEIDKLKLTDAVNPHVWDKFIGNLTSVLGIVKDGIYIYSDSKNTIPVFIKDLFHQRCIEFGDELANCLRPPSQHSSGVDYASHREQAITTFNNRFKSTEFIQFFEPIYLIKSFQKPTRSFESEFKRLMEEALPNTDTIIKNIKANQQTVNTLTSSVQNKAKKHITSDYSGVFQEVCNKHKGYSSWWLFIGIVSVVVFICTLSFGAFDGLETENLSATGEFESYNIGNIMARLLILAIQVFFISFSFKQYTVNRHLQNVNRHRANAFESYQLFDNILPKDDEIHRNELMLQLSKAIYEQGSTGYLSEKGANFNLSLTEITKMLGKTQA